MYTLKNYYSIHIYFFLFLQFTFFFQTTLDNDKGRRRGVKIMEEKQYKEKESTKDSSLLAFEKFVSTQKVSFYSQQMDISN